MPEGPGGPRATTAATLIAFDFGLARIGVAVGDTVTGTAAPRAVVRSDRGRPNWPDIARLIADVRPARLVVGAPYNDDGSDSTMAAAARAFAAELHQRFALPVDVVDERFSSVEASESLRARRASGERRRRVQRGDVDSTAAAVILERWLAGERQPP